MQIKARWGWISHLSRETHDLAWPEVQGQLCEAKLKGCCILAELLESGRDQPWGGYGPTRPQPIEDLLLVPISWGAASCLHLDRSHWVQAGPRVPQALASSLWSPLEKS